MERNISENIIHINAEAVSYDQKITVIDDDHHLFEMFAPGPNGSMYKMMEITYTRKK